MEVTATRSERVKVDISDSDFKEAMLEFDGDPTCFVEALENSFKRRWKVPRDWFLKKSHNGKVFWNTCEKYHTWSDYEQREATEEEVEVMQAIDNIRATRAYHALK